MATLASIGLMAWSHKFPSLYYKMQAWTCWMMSLYNQVIAGSLPSQKNLFYQLSSSMLLLHIPQLAFSLQKKNYNSVCWEFANLWLRWGQISSFWHWSISSLAALCPSQNPRSTAIQLRLWPSMAAGLQKSSSQALIVFDGRWSLCLPHRNHPHWTKHCLHFTWRFRSYTTCDFLPPSPDKCVQKLCSLAGAVQLT